MFMFSVCDSDGEKYHQRIDGPEVRQIRGTRMLRDLWDGDTQQVMHNAKFDVTMAERALGRRDLRHKKFHDTYMQHHILHSSHPSHELKQLLWEYCGYPRDDETAVKKYLNSPRGYQDCPEHLMDKYAANDAERAMLLHLHLYPKILANEQYKEIYQTEMDLITATIAMEERGIMIDRKRTQELVDDLTAKTRRTEAEFTALTNEPVSTINSPKKLAHLLFNKLKMPVVKKTPTGSPSVDKDALAELKENYSNDTLELILMYRAWSNGSTMIKSYLDLADEEGIIHPDIHTCKAKTSRQSSRRPNLQNVQKEGVLLNPYPVPARRAFKPRPGFVNFHIDYSGIEMRLLVHYSGEELLIKIANEGGDIHEPAATIFYMDQFINAEKEERKSLRGAAKNANFAVPYGASWMKMAKTLGLSGPVGQARFREYCKTFPKLTSLTKTIIEEVKGNRGFVTTTFGRKLDVPLSKPYVGTNYKIQGTAAGVLKRAQVRIYKYLLDTGLLGDMNVLLPIHDEVIIEMSRKLLPDAKKILGDIRELMMDFPQFSLPLEVEVQLATADWSNKKEFKL